MKSLFHNISPYTISIIRSKDNIFVVYKQFNEKYIANY